MSDKIIARQCFGFSVLCVGIAIAKSGTYACRMREDIGLEGCIAVGITLVWLAGWLTFGAGRME